MNVDLINGCFEMVGGCLTWTNFYKLRKDKEIKGVYWPVTLFFSIWGIWNLIYYPALNQWFSYYFGIFLVSGNVFWIIFVCKYLYFKDKNE